MSKGLLVKKTIKSLLEEASEKRGLKRSLGPFNLVAMGIGAIIGAGIFVLSGQAAAEYAGPGIVFSFLLVAIICGFVALCYAEFASLIPIAGSAYSYAYVTMGEFIAWIIGWSLTLEYLFSASTIAVGWSGYFTSFLNDLGVSIPAALATTPLAYDPAAGWEATGSLINLPAVLIVLLVGILISVGIKMAATVNTILGILKVAVILLFIVCGIAFVNTDNWQPFIPANTGMFGQFGWSGVLRGAGVVFFAFIGFDAVSTLAQEAKDPQKNMPIGMLGSLGISTIVYIAVALVMTGIVSYTMLNVSDPIAVAVNALGENFRWLRYVTKIAIIAGLTTGVLVMLLGQSRIFYIMAHDGLLPSIFGKIHHKFSTPFASTMILTVAGALVAGIFPVGILGQLVNMGTLFPFAIVCFGVLILRYKQPLLHRPFKTPLVPWIPLIGTLGCLGLMVSLPGVTWFQMLAWMALGCVIYFNYGKKHSKIRMRG